MKENYQIYLPYQFHWRPQSAGRDPQLPNKKMKTMFLSNMSKSRRLTSTFFPISSSARSFSENVSDKEKNFCMKSYCYNNIQTISAHRRSQWKSSLRRSNANVNAVGHHIATIRAEFLFEGRTHEDQSQNDESGDDEQGVFPPHSSSTFDDDDDAVITDSDF